MPAWLVTAIENIGPITSVAESIEKLGAHIVDVLKGGESVSSVFGALSQFGADVHNAIHANTTPAEAPADPAPPPAS